MTLYVECLRTGLHRLFDERDDIVMLGEDIRDPYGGAFKVTEGLSTKHPERVRNTPICEATIVGMGIGLALRGQSAVVEIMFGDFVTIAADQIVNHAAKFGLMFGRSVPIPLVIRAPMGGGRGYGPTHSQSLEKLFLGIPGLLVMAPSHFHDPGEMLRDAVNQRRPVLFIENKLLYSRPLIQPDDPRFRVSRSDSRPGFTVTAMNYAMDERPDIAVITYGGMSRLLEELLVYWQEEEIRAKVVFAGALCPLDEEPILRAVGEAGRAVVIEEGHRGFNWGSEVSHRIHTALFGKLAAPVALVASEDQVIPASFEKEREVLVNRDKINQAVIEVMAW